MDEITQDLESLRSAGFITTILNHRCLLLTPHIICLERKSTFSLPSFKIQYITLAIEVNTDHLTKLKQCQISNQQQPDLQENKKICELLYGLNFNTAWHTLTLSLYHYTVLLQPSLVPRSHPLHWIDSGDFCNIFWAIRQPWFH